MELSKSIALVTGGGSGLGLAITNDIIKSGGIAIVLDRDATALEAIELNPNLHTYQVDLLETEKLLDLLKVIFDKHKVNVLINNAGILHNKPLVSFGASGFSKLSEIEWDLVLNINLRVPFILCREVSEHFIRNRTKGVMINISSIAAQGNIGQSAYSASKAGLEAFTVVLAKELGPMGIRAAAIAPGFMDTSSTHQIMNPSYLINLVKSIPMRKLGKDSEIAKSVKFIIENEYYTGKILSIDGGLNL